MKFNENIPSAFNPKAGGHADIWQETLPVRFGEIDKSDRMTLGAIFRNFQEAAISHADNLDVGREEMAQSGQVWILSRMSTVVQRRPNYRETITVRSWPRGGEKLFAIRDYDIRDKNDIPVVSARSCWIIIDIEKRRPLRPQSVMGNLPLNDGINAAFINEELAANTSVAASALAQRDNLVKTAERKALYTDVDYNGHVNNVRYVQWIEDALDPALLENAGKMRFDINYLNEILSGETIELMSAAIAGTDTEQAFAFEGRKDGQAAFRAELRLWN